MLKQNKYTFYIWGFNLKTLGVALVRKVCVGIGVTYTCMKYHMISIYLFTFNLFIIN